jgi:hypothetical protein
MRKVGAVAALVLLGSCSGSPAGGLPTFDSKVARLESLVSQLASTAKAWTVRHGAPPAMRAMQPELADLEIEVPCKVLRMWWEDRVLFVRAEVDDQQWEVSEPFPGNRAVLPRSRRIDSL